MWAKFGERRINIMLMREYIVDGNILKLTSYDGTEVEMEFYDPDEAREAAQALDNNLLQITSMVNIHMFLSR
jgi:hypothetical protein